MAYSFRGLVRKQGEMSERFIERNDEQFLTTIEPRVSYSDHLWQSCMINRKESRISELKRELMKWRPNCSFYEDEGINETVVRIDCMVRKKTITHARSQMAIVSWVGDYVSRGFAKYIEGGCQ
jgi:hypothetical protein